MSQGTLYGDAQSRVLVPKGLVKVLGLDVKFAGVDAPEFKTNFPLAKVPAFVGPKGLKLTEVIAIIYYLVSLKDENSPLLGKTLQDRAQVLKWLSFGTSELLSTATTAFAPFLGRAPYNKKVVDDALAKIALHVSVLESRLTEFTYLVGERLTVADLFVASVFYRPLTVLYGKEWRAEHPVLMRWFNTVTSTEYLNWFFADVKLADKPVEAPKPQKKESAKAKAPKAPKAAAKPAADAAEDMPVEEKKPKHPLEALGKPKIPIDEWKRKYSNEDTRAVALPYFWNEFYNEEDWSIWKVAYKYNDELTLTFMSNNLVGGFFARLQASTKFLFGSAVVYGENNNNGIIGAFLVRGQDAIPAFDVAPDWESYEITKLDASNPEDRAFLENMWAWDKPYNGQEIVDGKVFK